MRGGARNGRHRIPLTAAGWLVVALCVAVLIGVLIGSDVLWIAAAVILLFVLMAAFAVPRNVKDLNVPPGMMNAPGDPTTHDSEDRD